MIAVSAPERLPALPNMPTLAELGYKNANLTSLFGFYAPAGTPPEVVQRFNGEVNKLLSQPDMREPLRKLDNVATGGKSGGDVPGVLAGTGAPNRALRKVIDLKHVTLIHELSMDGDAGFPTWDMWFQKTRGEALRLPAA